MNNEDKKLIAEALGIKYSDVRIDGKDWSPFHPLYPKNVWRMHIKLMERYGQCNLNEFEKGHWAVDYYRPYQSGVKGYDAYGASPEEATAKAFLQMIRELTEAP